METRDFHIADVLSVTTGRLFSLRMVEGVQDILSFMCGHSVMTHEIPRAIRTAGPHLLRQHPQLRDVDLSALNWETANTHISGWVDQFGETLPCDPLPAGAYEACDPVEEVQAMVGEERTIIVDTGSRLP